MIGQAAIKHEVVNELDDDKNFDINDYINEVPLLVDEMTDDEDDELESRRSVRGYDSKVQVDVSVSGTSLNGSNLPSTSASASTNAGTDPVPQTCTNSTNSTNSNSTSITSKSLRSNKTTIKQERNQLMMVVIKYISIKITNLFPPSSSESKISLEKFLIIMINRLKLSLPNFLKAIIYLFRYMDIIYLLRYLNQSNNFANFTEMDFPLKKLIIGCFKLTLLRERVHKNWGKLTGLGDNEVNVVIQSILKRLNNKIIIKESELSKFKLEVFRYVKMVSNEV